jgi:hypothetical protein
MNRIEVNVITGEQIVVPLTPEEIAEIQSRPQPEPPDPLNLAESHVASFFSTGRLLQMKVWWDTFPHTITPKLAAVYLWADGITRSALAGTTDFSAPPHTFVEVAEEITNIPIT